MYTKTQWVDNTTPIDKDNLNKIEQGIYDNSLVVDAVTNTLNPTDTETYKTAELTEGQITDVIGVNDIVIKGQTSQDGEPTPSSPVDVNVVSGSNVINTSSKNLFDGILENSGFQATGLNSEGNTKRIRSKNYIRVKENQTYTINITEYNTTKGTISIGISYYNKNDYSTARLSESGWKNLPYTFITPENCKFIRFLCKIKITSSSEDSEIVYTDVNRVQLEQSSTATTYELHQGKELPLDLPVENMFDKNNYVAGQVYSNNTITANTPWGIFYLPCTSGETYIISGLKTYSGTQIVQCNSNKQFILNLVTRSTENTEYTITATQNGYIGISFVWSASASKGSELDTINIKKAGTEPIELCKIGNYQDYFYKSGSKWYLHKEIGKVILDGSENWTYSSSNTVFYTDVINALAMQDCNIVCDRFKKIANSTSYANINNGEIKVQTSTGINARLICKYTNYTSVADFKTWLASNNTTVYYPLATETNTEITNTTLISQLEAIYNAPLYEQTNITQINNDLPMVLDITACKDNINGIKAFIRK